VKESNFLEAQKTHCKSCIFKNADFLSPKRQVEIIKYLLTGQQHICHQTHGSNELACRGGRDLQLRHLAALGWITEPTDDALEMANEEWLASKHLEITDETDF
jgi:hypothetical protein